MQPNATAVQFSTRSEQEPVSGAQRRDCAIEQGFRIDQCEVRPLQSLVVRPDGVVHVEHKVMDVLVLLAKRQGRIVSRRELLDSLWEGHPESDEALTRAVCTLRKHLGDDCHWPRYLATAYRQGYRLIPTVLPLADSPAKDSRAEQSASRVVIGMKTPAVTSPLKPTALGELSRRRVFRAGSTYAVVGWILLQVAETTFEPLGVPSWGMTLLLLVVLLGFPSTLALAWALQMTPQGLVLEMPIRRGAAERCLAAERGFHYAMHVGLTLVVLALGYRMISLEPVQRQVSAAGTTSAQPVNENDSTVITADNQ